ncbi:MAG: HEAT repeat domain-containing protein [Armatimonadetes bacterium]|nr:HEAT repeat domain-containing protein [Armatimonadota bacterium]MDE2207813.1 HEAT repeat domain-containing protein [Armatimonadota bacterium]
MAVNPLHSALLRLYRQGAPYSVRMRIVDLIRYDEDRAAELIIEAMADPSAAVRAVAASRMNNSEYIPLLTGAALSDPSPVVRATAVRRLGRIQKQWCAPVFLRAINDRAGSVRSEAAAALALSGSAGGIDAIRGAMAGERHRCVRISYYAALVQLGAPEWLGALCAELRAPSAVARARAAALLAAVATAKTAERAIDALAAAYGQTADYATCVALADAICALACVGSGAAEALVRLSGQRPADEILSRAVGIAWARSGGTEASAEALTVGGAARSGAPPSRH